MNEVKRFRADHRHVVETEFDDAQYVLVADYDAAKAEISALRDELCIAKDHFVCSEQVKSAAYQLLDAANHKNAELIEFLVSVSKPTSVGEAFANAVLIRRLLQDIKPVESGAS